MSTTSQNHPSDDKLTISWRHQARRVMTTSCQTWGWWQHLCLWGKDQTWSPHAPTTQSRRIQPWVGSLYIECLKSWVALMFTKDHIFTQKTDKTASSTKLVVISMAVPESFRQCRLSYSPRWRVDRSNSKLRPRFLKNNHNSWNQNLDSEERRKSSKF